MVGFSLGGWLPANWQAQHSSQTGNDSISEALIISLVRTPHKPMWYHNLSEFEGGSSKLTDPIADTAACKRDVEEFKKLGINTVRIYTIDNSASHDDCMKILADAGIYLALDVNSPQYSLNRQDSSAIAASYNDVSYSYFHFPFIQD
jgi:hypothetical protein